MDRDNRNMENVGRAMSEVLQDLQAQIDAGNIGVTAAAKDVDSLAKDGGAFSQDGDTTTGLTFGYKEGRLFNAGTLVTVSASTIALTNNTTNYVEVSAAGVVSVNTSGFTAGRIPLYQILTSGGAIVTVTNKKPLLSIVGDGSINSAKSAAQVKTITISRNLGDISATGEFRLPPCPGHLGKVTAVRFVTSTNLTASDTNYWTFALENKGNDGTGTEAVLAATDANTTKATGGSALDTDTPRSFTLHGTAANLDTLAGAVLVLTVTKTASATTMVDCCIQVDLEMQDP